MQKKKKSLKIKKEIDMNPSTHVKNWVELIWMVWAVFATATAATATNHTFTLRKIASLLSNFIFFLAFYNVARFSLASSILRFKTNSQSIHFDDWFCNEEEEGKQIKWLILIVSIFLPRGHHSNCSTYFIVVLNAQHN